MSNRLTFVVLIQDTDEQQPAIYVGQTAGAQMARIVESKLPYEAMATIERDPEAFIYKWIEEHYLVSAPHGAVRKYRNPGLTLYEVDYDGPDLAQPKASYCAHKMYARGRCAEIGCWNYVNRHPNPVCEAHGPREASSTCVRPFEHEGTHRDTAGGVWW